MEKFTWEILLVVGGLVLGTFQWLIKKWVETLDKAITHLQRNQEVIDKEVQHIKETYVQKADMKDVKDEIVVRLIRIESYLMEKKDV